MSEYESIYIIGGGGGSGGGSVLDKFKRGECAPQVGNSSTCSRATTVAAIHEWLESQHTHTASDAKSVIAAARLATDCASESCLYTKKTALLKHVGARVAERELHDQFAPEGPHDSIAWLSNDNVDDVLDGYTHAYPKFLHIPYAMSDFQSYASELAVVDLVQIQAGKKYTSMGVVLNCDKRGGPGTHWTALYVDFVAHTLEWWDSTGDPPFDEIETYMIEQSALLNKTATGARWCIVNVCEDIVHQTKNSECGIYSIFYIICRLRGEPYSFFRQSAIEDDVMTAFRKYVFRHS